jgi:hypothetical protein
MILVVNSLSIDVSLMSDIVEDQDKKDQDYEPEFEMTPVLWVKLLFI